MLLLLCTVIVKPSEVAPETGAMVVQAMASVLPPDVLQLAQGDGSVGAHLVAHPKVDMICMTGSSATGKKILESAAPKMKRFVLELGGKSPCSQSLPSFHVFTKFPVGQAKIP